MSILGRMADRARDRAAARRFSQSWPDAYVDVGGVAHKVRADGRVACTGAGPVESLPTVDVWTREAACEDCEWPHPRDGGR